MRDISSFVYLPDSLNNGNRIKISMINGDFRINLYGMIVQLQENSFKELKYLCLSHFLENQKFNPNLFCFQILKIKAIIGENKNINSITNANDQISYLNTEIPSKKSKFRKINKKTSIIENIQNDDANDSELEEQKAFSDPILSSNLKDDQISYKKSKFLKEESKNEFNFRINEELSFQSNNISNPIEPSKEFSKFKGKVFIMSKKQQSSRLSCFNSRVLQKFIERCEQIEVIEILDEIKDHLPIILKDDYANYMFQALCKRCSPQMRYDIVKFIFQKIPSIAKHKKGTHSLQSIVSYMNTDDEQLLVVESIIDHIVDLTKNLNGTHFIQKLIISFKNSNIIKILNAVIQNFNTITMDQYGVCTVKILIEKYTSASNYERKIIVDTILQNFDFLVQDPFANYSINHCLEKYEYFDNFKIIVKISEKLLILSLQKFSSFVVERCIFLYYPKMKEALVYLVNEDMIAELSKSNYGSHVIKTLTQITAENDKFELMRLRNLIYSSLLNSQHESQKKILQKLLVFIEKT